MKNEYLLTASKEHLLESYNAEADENSKLRTILLEMASRPEITNETRQWLSSRLKNKDVEIVKGLREDEMSEVRDTMKAVEKLHDHVRRLVDASEEDSKKIERTWYQQADAYCNQVSGRLQETRSMLGRDLEDLEEAR